MIQKMQLYHIKRITKALNSIGEAAAAEVTEFNLPLVLSVDTGDTAYNNLKHNVESTHTARQYINSGTENKLKVGDFIIYSDSEIYRVNFAYPVLNKLIIADLIRVDKIG